MLLESSYPPILSLMVIQEFFLLNNYSRVTQLFWHYRIIQLQLTLFLFSFSKPALLVLYQKEFLVKQAMKAVRSMGVSSRCA